MVTVRHPFQSKIGHIKLSRARGVSHFQHTTEGVALKYVSQGYERYLVRGEYISLSAGQFMLLVPGQPYEAITTSAHSLTQGICVDLDPDFAPNMLGDKLWFMTPFQGSNFLELSQALIGLNSTDVRVEGENVLHQLKNGLSDLTQHISEISDRVRGLAKKPGTQKLLLSKLILAKDYLHQYFDRAITLQELSLHTGLSPYYLNRTFRDCFGLTPYQFQLRLRMEKAQCLLLHTQHSLTAIALSLGYSDLSAFSVQFRKYYHQTPSSYRMDC